MTTYYVTNRETRTQTIDRDIVYNLLKELPIDWEKLSLDEQGIWINENAEFVKDDFTDAEYGDVEEETITIEEYEEGE